MNTKNKIPFRSTYSWYLFVLIITTVFTVAVSLYCLNAGWFIVFQNLFYFPIIIACVYYLGKGFVFSVLLALFYLSLILAYTPDYTIIREAIIRVAIFVMVAGVALFLSLKRQRIEEEQNRVRSWQEGINRILGLVLEPVPFDEKLKRITDGVVETFGADFCRIWIIGKGDLCSAGCMHTEALEGPHVCHYRDKCLHLKASSGRYTHLDGKAHRRVPFGAYKIGRIASGEEVRFLTNDVRHDPRVHDNEWAKSLGLTAFAGYRLQPPNGETLGVLALFSKFEISPDMDAVLEGLSEVIALVIQKDIAERALKESGEALIRIKKAVESSGEAIGMSDPQGRHFYHNKAFHDLFEYSVEELNKPLAPIVVYADPEVGREVFETVMRGGPWTGETIMAAKGGRRFPVFLRADAVKDDNGNIIGLIGIHTDITERKIAEADLVREKNQLKNLLHLYQHPYMQTRDLESFVIEECIKISESRLGFFGFINEEETVMTAHLWSEKAMKGCAIDFKPVEFSLYHAGIWAEAIREHKPLIVNDYSRPDPRKKGYPEGHVTIQRLMSIPVIREAKAVAIAAVANKEQDYDEADLLHLSLFLESAWDMFERKRAEEVLNSSEAYFRSLIENASDIITIVDGDGIVRYISPSLERVTGFETSELTGRNIFEYVHPDDVYAATDILARAVKNPGIALPVELRMRHHDGPWHIFEIVAQNLLQNEAVKGIVVNSHDITERRQAEQRLSEEVALKNFLLDLFKKAPALPDKDLYDYVLDHVVRVTDSAIGFFHLVSDDQKNVILTAWNTEALKNCTASYATHYPLEQAGNWVDCVRLKRPVLYNEFSISPNRKGLPEGHTPVKRFMSVPVVEGDKVRIIFGVGNKSEEYNELDAVRIQIVANDLQKIMAQRRAEEELSNSEQKLKAVLYGSPIPQFVIDRNHQVVFWNNALEEITRIRASEVIGTNKHWQAFYGADRPCLADLMVDGAIERFPELYHGKYSRSKLVDGAYEATDYFPTLGEDGKWLFFTAVVIRDVNGQVIGALETLEDVTERKQAEEEIFTLSITDQLTGLYNRRGFTTFADQQLRLSDRTKREMLLFFADLDRMKWINDTFGHEEGDRALMEVAAILRETFRSVDIIARMGGDEFAILAVDSTEVNSEIFTTRLQEKIDAHNHQENRRYNLSISIGCSCYDPENPCSLDELMVSSDRLMYEHKRSKQN